MAYDKTYYDNRKRELAEQFDINIKRAYGKIKQLVFEENEDSNRLQQAFQALIKQEEESKKNEQLPADSKSGQKKNA